jgi:hypothetical protein
MPKVFQNVGQNDIYLPSYGPDASGLASYDVQSDTILVPATPPNFDNIKDIVRVTLCGIELVNDRCHRHEFVVNDASSRCMINVLQINENGVDILPGNIHFKVRQSSKCIPTVRFDGIWSPTANGENWSANGLLVQIGGMLSTSWEVQAEVVPFPGQLPLPSSYSWVLEFIFDRLGDNNQAIKGANTTGTLLPLQ